MDTVYPPAHSLKTSVLETSVLETSVLETSVCRARSQTVCVLINEASVDELDNSHACTGNVIFYFVSVLRHN